MRKQVSAQLKFIYKNLTYNTGNPELIKPAANNGNIFSSMQMNVANTYSAGIVFDLYFQNAAGEKFYIIKDAKIGRGYNIDFLEGHPKGLTWSDDMDLYTKISTGSGTASLIMSYMGLFQAQ
tara:strand:+ start:133 stop:498 length:366 start_codon:yes stop_codon:yes gene_type:complete